MFSETNVNNDRIRCSYCQHLIVPIIKKNTLGMTTAPGWAGRVGTGLSKPKKTILVCPLCKAVLSSK
jgi:hypothetical protein